jgi:hypothetical protein
MMRDPLWQDSFGLEEENAGKMGLSAQLNNFIASIQRRFNQGPESLKCRQKVCSPAIAKTYPQDSGCRFWPVDKIKKILILADNYALFMIGISANFDIRSSSQANIQNMLAVVTMISQMPGESRWKLVID